MSVKVEVLEQADRRCFLFRWIDPNSGKRRFKSSGVEITGRKKERKEAEKRAAQLEADLQNGRFKEPSKITWRDFKERYFDEGTTDMRSGTIQKIGNLFNLIDEHASVERLAQMTAARINTLVNALRAKGNSESTIAGYCAHLEGRALNWARRMRMIHETPEFPKFKGSCFESRKGACSILRGIRKDADEHGQRSWRGSRSRMETPSSWSLGYRPANQ